MCAGQRQGKHPRGARPERRGPGDLEQGTFVKQKSAGKGGAVVAIYHLTAKVISRGHGKSCVAAAAYRDGRN